MQTIHDTINSLLVIVGGGLISGDVVAFIFGLAQNNLVDIDWYLGIGIIGFLMVLIGESRIYKVILLNPKG